MRKLFLFVFFVSVISVTAQGQSDSKPIDAYGGYSFLSARSDAVRISSRDNDNSLNLNGFNVGGTFWINSSRTMGITGDYTFHTKTENTALRNSTVGGVTTVPGVVTPIFIPSETRFRYNTFQTGPAIRFKKGRLTPFAHGLFGTTRISARVRAPGAPGTGSNLPGLNFTAFENNDTAFSLSVGGGLDIDLTESGRFAIRAGRIEYNYINSIRRLALDNQQNLRFSTGLVVRF